MPNDADDQEVLTRLAEKQREIGALRREIARDHGAPVRVSTEACPRCRPHQRCSAIVRCDPCALWICASCWWACNVGMQPHGEAGQGWFEHFRKLAMDAAPPDGSWGFSCCAEEEFYLHADRGGVFFAHTEWDTRSM